MIINSINLTNWRGYSSLSLEFSPKVNLIVGDNGSGKSNLAEAIYYISQTRSWRTSDQKVLIKEGEEESNITSQITKGIHRKEIQINLRKGEKRVFINGKKIPSLSELNKCSNIIVFSPSDVPLFLDSPSLRRNFLDVAICKVSPIYFDSLTNYSNILNQRNALLKDERIDLDLLSVLTSQLVTEANKITKERFNYIEKINKVLPRIVKELTGNELEAKLIYHPYINVDEAMEEEGKKKFEEARGNDLKLQHTTVGPHKEDYTFMFNKKDLASYGSQGQNRIAVLALKLSPYFLIEEEEEKPIVVLDDVTSELDPTNQDNLLKFVSKLSQVFITATNLQLEGANVINVSSNDISRRD